MPRGSAPIEDSSFGGVHNAFIAGLANALGWSPEDIAEIRISREGAEWRISVLKLPRKQLITVTVTTGVLKNA